MHELYGDPEIHAAVVARWGAEMAPEGHVDRAAVARRAFATDEDRAWLEGLLWPKVVESPLLFEAGLERAFDATIAIVADEAVRAERAAARGHESVDERTSRQLPQEEKAQKATYAIHNSGTLEELEQKLSDVLEKLSP